MKKEQDYLQDISEMRSLMERSSKFLSLSGLAGVLAGIYALAGAYVAWQILVFDPLATYATVEGALIPAELESFVLLGVLVLVFAVGSAGILSQKNSHKRKEKLWNPVTRRFLMHLLLPLVSGGILVLILIRQGSIGLVLPLTLIFYGLALFSAGKFTFGEITSLGAIQVALGLLAAWNPTVGLLCWAIGFGLAHIVYGIFMHYRYER